MKKISSRLLIVLSLLAAAQHGEAQIYTFSTLAGNPGINGLGSSNGTGSAAQFNQPYGVAVDSSNYVYVADSANNEIRKITPAGVVTTLAGGGLYESGTNDGAGSHARFFGPGGVAVDKSGNVYVADSENNAIRKITPAGVVSTLAGSPGSSGAGYSGTNDGGGSAARFWGPGAVAVDSSNYVYVADTLNNTIRKITPAGDVTTLAGQPGISGADDGVGSAAQFFSPRGLAVDGSGTVFVADTGNTTIRMITPGGQVSTFAGLARHNGFLDATGTNARFYQPDSVAVDTSNFLYVADTANDTIRKITPVGEVSTLASIDQQVGSSNGVGSAATFSAPAGIAVSGSGVLYIADEQNNEIREGVPAGVTYPSPVTITVGALPADALLVSSISPGQTVSSGTSVTVVAQANAGFAFVEWTVEGAVVSTNQSYTFVASTSEELVANFSKSGTSGGGVSVKTSASPPIAGTTSGGGSFTSGSTVRVMATSTNDCYEFVEWTVGTTKSTDNPYTFTATKNETAIATFAQLQYTISTDSSPAKAGTTSGGGKKGCGTTATITAHANPGFAFAGWTVPGDGGSFLLSNPYKFSVSEDEGLVANFRDIKPPVIAVISPTKNEAVPTAAFPIQGTASDNVGLAAVYYNLNGAGWTLATTTDGYSNWYAWVTLKPDGANTVSAYAVDTSGNMSTNGPVKFTCSAAGLAPLSIANHEAGVTEGTNTANSMLESFDSAMYASVSAETNDGGGVGTYTYTPTGANTAELVQKRVFPTQPAVAGATVAELTFTDAYTADYTNNAGTNGLYSFVITANIVPATLDGSSLVATSFENSNSISTNTFGASTFANEDSLGNSSAGTYTFTKFTEVAALLVETLTSPPSAVGTTNYIVLTFSTGTAPITGFYDYSSESAGKKENFDSGSFVLKLGTDTIRFLGPASLSGLQAVITPTGEPSFTRTYGNGTYASLSLKSADEPTDVGVVLANTRVSANTGFDQYMAVAPPYAVGLDAGTSDLTFTSASMANLSAAGSSVESAKVAYSKLLPNAPAALTGHTIVATPTGKGQTKSTLIFTFNTVKVIGNTAGNGTYTYAPYTSTMALVQFSFGSSDYVLLEFTSAAGGPYVYAQPGPAGWNYTEGTFTFAATK